MAAPRGLASVSLDPLEPLPETFEFGFHVGVFWRYEVHTGVLVMAASPLGTATVADLEVVVVLFGDRCKDAELQGPDLGGAAVYYLVDYLQVDRALPGFRELSSPCGAFFVVLFLIPHVFVPPDRGEVSVEDLDARCDVLGFPRVLVGADSEYIAVALYPPLSDGYFGSAACRTRSPTKVTSCVKTMTCRSVANSASRWATSDRRPWSSEVTGSSSTRADIVASKVTSVKKPDSPSAVCSPSLSTLATAADRAAPRSVGL